MEYKFCNPFEGDNDKSYVEQLTTDNNLCGKVVRKLIPVGSKVVTQETNDYDFPGNLPVTFEIIEEEYDCLFVCKEHMNHNEQARKQTKMERDLSFHRDMVNMGMDKPMNDALGYENELLSDAL